MARRQPTRREEDDSGIRPPLNTVIAKQIADEVERRVAEYMRKSEELKKKSDQTRAKYAKRWDEDPEDPDRRQGDSVTGLKGKGIKKPKKNMYSDLEMRIAKLVLKPDTSFKVENDLSSYIGKKKTNK